MKSDIANDYSVKFSMRPRTAMNSAFQNFTKNNPGPGAYNHISVAKDASGNNRAVFSYHSRMKSSGGVAISKGGERFDRSLLRASIDNPGPGMYKPKLNFDPKGSYSFSNWKSSGAPVFSKATRKVDLETSNTRKSKINILNLT